MEGFMDSSKSAREWLNEQYLVYFMYLMKDRMRRGYKVEIDKDGYVMSIDDELIEPTPLEDYGNYYLSKKPTRNAYDIWMDNLKDE